MEREDRTLGDWMDLAELLWGTNSDQYRFLSEKAAESTKGREEIVIADDSQMLYLLARMGGKAVE